MNARSFKVIFSKRLGALVAVGENATSQGKSASGEANRTCTCVLNEGDSASQHVGTLKALCLAALLITLSPAFALEANALPTQGKVVLGSAAISSIGAAMTITQSTDRAAINWQSFNVGTDARVNVVQNNSQSVLLNRVVGNEMSQIRGQISANGQVVLVNPNGIVMGPTGSITASAFTASTFGITDANFEAGHMKYERNGSTGKIVHQGHIQTAEAGGYVALIGADVNNQGAITNRQGAVVLAAADVVTLPSVTAINTVSVPLSSKVRLELNPDSFGSASVSNSGVIVTDGGQVLMRAAAVVDAVSKIADATVIQSGSIDTTGAQGGGVDILADHGRIRVSGSVKANSTNGSAGGDVYIGRDQDTNVLAAVGDASGATLESQGGFIETSGSFLKVDDISIKAKDWLLDPTNIRIVSGTPSPATPSSGTPSAGGTQTFQDDTAVAESRIQNTTINTALNGGVNVIISTGLRTDNNPVGTQDGNIIVDANASIAKTTGTDAKLTLIANNGITLNGSITGTSADGVLDVEMTAHGDSAIPTNSQGIVFNNSSINTNGDITLTATINNTSSNTEAIRFNNTTISARKYNITGTHRNTVVSAHGVVFNGTNSFTAKKDSSIRGFSRGSSWPPSIGVYYLNGSNTTFNSGTGHTSVMGVLTGSGDNGSRVSFNSGANITTKSSETGSVTLGSDQSSFFHRRGTIRADSGTLNILGSSITTYEPGAIIQGDNGTTINLRANSVALGTGPGGTSHIRPEANGGFTLNIAADRLVVHPGSTTSSGTGTTTIQNFTPGTRINLGGDDVSASDGNPATLGLSQAEIASFTAGNLRFGSDTSGPITVTQALSLNKIHITSKDNIRINAALTATATHALDAVVINAGIDKSAGDKTGGNIIFESGGSITVSNTSRATLYTGSLEGSTGLNILTGNNRYNSDEQPNGHKFTTQLGDTGTYAIYREAPVLKVTFNNQSKTYDGEAFNGGSFAVTGLVNNDSNTSQPATFTGNAENAKNAGTYVIDGKTTQTASALGYVVEHVAGTLRIDQKYVTLVGVRVVNKSYDGNTSALLSSPGSLDGLVDGEDLSLSATGVFEDPNVGNNKRVLVTTAIADGGNGLASNYRLLPVEPTPTASITAATEPVAPARPVVPGIPATPTNNNVVIAGGANSFQLASAEGSCTANTLEQCECEAASNNIQICYEPSSQAQ